MCLYVYEMIDGELVISCVNTWNVGEYINEFILMKCCDTSFMHKLCLIDGDNGW